MSKKKDAKKAARRNRRKITLTERQEGQLERRSKQEGIPPATWLRRVVSLALGDDD